MTFIGEAHDEGLPWLRLGLVWLAGAQQLLTLLAVPPVIPLIHRDLGLSETGIAILTGLPVLLFAAAAVPGSFLIARLGARRTVILGLGLSGVASGLRGLGPSTAVLFGMTFVMGVGIALFLPAILSLVSAWFPGRVGLATAVYVNGLLVGETLSASLTLPVVLPLVGGRWELSFAVWGLPLLLTGLLMAWLAPRAPDAAGTPHARWWPEWRRALTWRLGLLQGGSAAAYFGANTFLPDFLRLTGRAHLIGASLTMLNAGQLPASFVAVLVAARLVGRWDAFVIISVAALASLGVLLGGTWGPILGAGLLGFFFAFTLVLVRALPPTLADRTDVHRLSAGMFVIGYVYSFVVPLLGGAAWDLSHAPAAFFLPVAVGTLTVLGASLGLPRSPAAPSVKGSAGPRLGV